MAQLSVRRQEIILQLQHYKKTRSAAEQKQKQKRAEHAKACETVAVSLTFWLQLMAKGWTAQTIGIVPERINVTKSFKEIQAETKSVELAIKAAEKR